MSGAFPLTDLQAGYLVGSSGLDLGGFRPVLELDLDVGRLDPDRARAAFDALVQRHEQLRTLIRPDGTALVLEPAAVAPIQLPVTDLTGFEPADQEARLRELRTQLGDPGPDPTGWPLFQLRAVRLAPDRWRLLVAMSLLLLDSGSTRLVQHEWWRLYRDPAVELPPVARTFRDCVLEREQYRQAVEYRKHWQYWQDRLDTLPAGPALPLAATTPTGPDVRMIRRSCRLDRAAWQRLVSTARRNRVLPTTAMLHAFAETLGSFAADPRFCLNVLHQHWAVSDPAAAGIVGQFSSTLALEVDLTRDDDFWSRARRLQSQLWQDMSHSEVSAIQVTRELAARRGWSSRAALPYVFNSMLAAGKPDAEEGRPSCPVRSSGLRTPQVLVDNQLVDGPDGAVDCVWDVVDLAFRDGVAEAAFEVYARLVRAMAEAGPVSVAGSAVPVRRFPPDSVPAALLARVAADNELPVSRHPGRLEDGFLTWAAARPSATAVLAPERTLSYAELERASAAVAGWLRARGVGRGDLVPVVMRKGWEQVVAVLGVLRAGAAYCPVDAALPADRIGYLVHECQARAVLDQSGAGAYREDGDPSAAIPVLHVDLPAEPVAVPAAPGGRSDDLAYVIHTSGSTGRPKGVMVQHQAALNTVLEINTRIGLAGPDRVFGISSLSFDLSVWDIFGTLAAGAALVLPAGSSRPDPAGWARTAARHGVTVWNSVPALAEMLPELLEQTPDQPVPPIRAFLLSGDWLPTGLPDRLRRHWPDTGVLALGGATEAAIWSNAYPVAEVEKGWPSIPYGRPLPGQTMRVLDHRFAVRAAWVVGRIYIGGRGLAAGYWRDPERTAERFVTAPDGERLYWTGDLGRYWPDGTIEFLGREDRQAKIQGFRVEPGEVEAVIRTHPQVRDCLVAVEPGPQGRPRLVALLVGRDGVGDCAAAVATHLRQRLPQYLVPSWIRTVPGLELSANGKVDPVRSLATAKRAPAREPAAGPDQGDDPVLAGLLALYAELLETTELDPDSDFFALGGNSLLALRLVHRAQELTGARLRFGEVFEAPTPRALAARIASGDRSTGAAVVLSDRPGVPLVLFHPVGGSVSSYLALAQAWPGPVTAFQRQVTEDDDPGAAPVSLTELATGYRQELQRRSPSGPYLLGGWSMGGVLAHEVARQLRELGQPAAAFLIDSSAQEHRRPAGPAADHLEFLTDLAGGRLPVAVRQAVLEADGADLVTSARHSAVAAGLLPAEAAQAYPALVEVHRQNLLALAGHQPGPGAGPALLIVARDALGRADPVAGWRQVCPRLEVASWAGDHYSVIAADRVPALVARVSAWWSGVAGELGEP